MVPRPWRPAWLLLLPYTLAHSVPLDGRGQEASQVPTGRSRNNEEADSTTPDALPKRLYSLSPHIQHNLAIIVSMTIKLEGIKTSEQNECLIHLVKMADSEFTKMATPEALEAMWSTDDGISEEEMLDVMHKTLASLTALLPSEEEFLEDHCPRVSTEGVSESLSRIALAMARATMKGSTARFQGYQSSTDQALEALFPPWLVGWGLCFLIVSSILGLSSCCCGLWNCRLTRKNPRFRSPIDKGLLIRGKQLGSGGFGSVYLCTLKGSSELRVVKMITVDMDDMSAVQEALEEAKKLISLRHPNIVKYIDIFLHRQRIGEVDIDDYVCIVMEHCNGGCIRDLMEAEGFVNFNVWQVLDAFHQVCLGLESTHQMGIVHTDIKLENIMVTILKDGRLILKIGDYGLAVHTGSDGSEPRIGTTPGLLRVAPKAVVGKSSKKIAQVSVKGNVTEACGGTPAYIAPEVFQSFDHFSEEPMEVDKYNSVIECDRKSVVNFAVDIWALAFVLYELTGLDIPDEEPYPGQLALDRDNWQESLDEYSVELRKSFEKAILESKIATGKEERRTSAGKNGRDDLEQNFKKTDSADDVRRDNNKNEIGDVNFVRGAHKKGQAVVTSTTINERGLLQSLNSWESEELSKEAHGSRGTEEKSTDNDEDEDEDEYSDRKEGERESKLNFADTLNAMKSCPVGSDERTSAELLEIFRRMLTRRPKDRPSVTELLKSPVFALLPGSAARSEWEDKNKELVRQISSSNLTVESSKDEKIARG